MNDITTNRHALKLIAQLHVDSQFSHQYGTQLFNYQGEHNTQYQHLCQELQATFVDLEKTLTALKTHLPTQG